MNNTESKNAGNNDKNENTVVSNADKNTNDKKKSGGSKVFLTILLVILVVGISMTCAFAYLIRINYYGLADKFRKNLENVPVVKLVLPPPYDPESPYVMPFHILASKYNEIRAKKSELDDEVIRLNSIVDELSYYKDNADSIKADNEKLNNELAVGLQEYERKSKQYYEIKLELDKRIANIDINEFRKYYETVDANNAKLIYEDIARQDVVDKRWKELVSIYEAMDATTAAGILQKMGTSKMQIIADILFNMKKESSSAIISAMKQDFAVKVMDQLSKLYRK